MFDLCKEYDERQQIIRGSICRHIMVIMGICIFINGIIEDAGFIWPDKFIAGIILIMVPVTIGTVEMNIRGVYLSKDRQVFFVVIFGLVALANVVLLISHNEPLFTEGTITDYGEHAVLAICFLTIFIAAIIRLVYDKHMEKIEE
ncbi:hypothetical protein [Eubacterium sp. 1001713B170207_170306_E7]|uniref:hypothetical protein n=1 Tax=Eubacterium sp. 1001713B170207_170306_E7 TaxID=2787097 RepID=UPI001896F205|nr:hypothetical protein [Eubacterium sp. 1001713B170207_170306_E7]